MALPIITVLTPENLKTILLDVFSTYSSKLSAKFSVKNIEFEHKSTITSDTISLPIGISEYNITNDILHIYKDNILIDKTEYTINTDKTVTFNSNITTTVEVPVIIKFIVIQSQLKLNT